MYKVYFENKFMERRAIGECSNTSELWSVINKFLDDHNFKSYYSRLNYLDNEVQIDVGSHSEFFYVDKKVFEENK